MKKVFTILVILLVIAFNLWLGIPRLARYSAVDEPYWTYTRTPQFWRAIINHKWKSTNINDKPGVTVALISGAGLLKVDPLPLKSLRGDPKTESQARDIQNINFYLRLPIFIFVLMLLPLFYFFLRKLFNDKIALLGFTLIGLSPILLGMSMIINPDSLIWLFVSFSLLAYFVYRKNEKKKYLLISAISLGFALLTKYVANILYVFFFLLPLLEYILEEQKPPLRQYIKRAVIDYAILVAVSMAVFFFFFPATWKNPQLLLKGTFLSKAFLSTWPLFAGLVGFIALDLLVLKNKITGWLLGWFSKYQRIIIRFFIALFLLAVAFTLFNTYSGMKFYDFESIIASPKGADFNSAVFLGKILADVYSLIFGINPLILLGALFFLVLVFLGNKQCSDSEKITFYFILFILLYYFASTINAVVATVRYQIMLYPLFMIIGALGINYIISYVIQKVKIFQEYMLFIAASVIILAVSIISLIQIKPFYLAYASRLLPQKYVLNLKGMGDGNYEAGNYLNNMPDAQNLTIWSDKGGVCESFVGNCVVGFTKKDLIGKYFSYFVVSSDRQSRSLKFSLNHGVSEIFNFNFKDLYLKDAGVFELFIDGRPGNFVKVIKNPNM